MLWVVEGGVEATLTLYFQPQLLAYCLKNNILRVEGGVEVTLLYTGKKYEIHV